MKLIGLTGSMQSGKQELRPVFERLGFYYWDLNDLVYEVHQRDRDTLYAHLGLAEHLRADGRELGGYYERIGAHPEIHRMAQDREEAYVLARVLAALPLLAGHQYVVLNWGYVYKLLGRIVFDHVILAEPDEAVWIRRIQKVTRRDGFSHDLDPDDIRNFARAIEMDPSAILEVVARTMGQRWSLVDTSSDDWGEPNLVHELKRLGYIG